MAVPMSCLNMCRSLTCTFKTVKSAGTKSHIYVSSYNHLRKTRDIWPNDDIVSNFSTAALLADFNLSRQLRTKTTPTVSGRISGARRLETLTGHHRVRVLHSRNSDYDGKGSSAQQRVNHLRSNEGFVPRYDKAAASDKRLGRAMMLANSRKFREQKGKVVLEGSRLIADALEVGAKAETIFFSQVSNIEGLPLQGSKVNLVKVAYRDIKLWSELTTPQGIVGVFQQPSYDKLYMKNSGSKERLPLTLICDNIRDPGNLGTILRSAAAAACQKVIVSKGCVDVWEPKVLRAGAGAHFRIPIIPNVPWRSIPNYLDPESCIHVADCSHAAPDRNDGHATQDSSETNGHTTRAVGKSWGEDTSEFNPKDSSGSDYADKDQESQFGPVSQTVPYFNQNWVTETSAIVVGGEADGLSQEALELCLATGGTRVHIPMSLGVESLNAAMATGIILFEAKRQLLMSSA